MEKTIGIVHRYEETDSEEVVMTQAQLDEIIKSTAEKTAETVNKSWNDRMAEIPSTIEGALSKHSGRDRTSRLRKSAFGQVLMSVAAGRNDPARAAQYAEKHFPTDVVQKTLTTGVSASGGAMVLEDLADDVIEALRTRSVLRAAGVPVVPMPNGNISFPRFNTGAAAAYVGEALPRAATEPTTDQVTLRSKRLTILVPVSRQLLMTNHINVAEMLQRDAIDAIADAEDAAFLRGAAGGVTPTGLITLALANGQASATAGSSPAQIEADVASLVTQLEQDNVRTEGAFFVENPRTLYQGQMTARSGTGDLIFPELRDARDQMMIFGRNVHTSTSIPDNLGAGTETEILFAQTNDIIIGEFGSMEVMLSEEGSYVDAGGATISAIQHDIAILKIVVNHDLAVRHNESVAVKTGVLY